MSTKQVNRNSRLYIVLFVLVFLISNFNALLQIYIPRMALTGIYLLVLGVAILKNLHDNHFRVAIGNGALAILLYILWNILRFVFQLIGGERTSQSFISFAQTLVPIFAFYIAIELNNEDIKNAKKHMYGWQL